MADHRIHTTGEHKAFFYGTLMAPEVLNRVIYNTAKRPRHEPERLKMVPAILDDYKRHRVAGADYPAIVAGAGSFVRGCFVTGLIARDLRSLDYFEGAEYERRVVRVRLLEQVEDGGGAGAESGGVRGEEVEAETYVWIAGVKRLEDREWDFKDFVMEKMGNWVVDDAHGEFADLEDAMSKTDEEQEAGTSVAREAEEPSNSAL